MSNTTSLKEFKSVPTLTWPSVSTDVMDGQLLVLHDFLLVGHDHLAAGQHQVVAASLGFVHDLMVIKIYIITNLDRLKDKQLIMKG